MATIAEILGRVSDTITGYLADLKTVAKSNLVAAINELVVRTNTKLVYGDQNQVLVPKTDNSSDYETIDVVTRGAFITTDAELASAKLIYVSPATIFSTWKRFSHGAGAFGSGTPVLSNVIPGLPSETNSWSYNSSTNTINSTVNSASHIGFYSPEKYSDYTHSVTFSANSSDNDYIATIIAYVEDKNDMVANNAYGLNPADFSWPIDVTSQFIPNQHTLTLVRGRTAQINHPFPTPARYAIVYDMGKLTQRILVNGEASGVWNTTNSFSASPTVDVKVIRSGDLIKTYTTDWSDAPSGKGTLRFELTYDLASLDITNIFRGSASYGFSAITQQNSTFTNDFFSQNINSIYDVRNGQKWVGDNAGNYSLSSTETLYTDFGVRRLFWNPVTKNFIEVWPDSSFSVVNSGIVDLTGLVPKTRTITINGTTYDLSADRSWTISTGLSSISWGAITGTLSNQADLNTALSAKTDKAITLTINGVGYDLSANRTWTIATGTVTSVGLAMPGVIFNPPVGNSPVTSSGTLTPTLKTQVANTALLGPTTGVDATPTFRAITNADIAPVTGLLTNLTTTDKTLLVNAINEVLTKVTSNNITQNQKINSLAMNFAQSII